MSSVPHIIPAIIYRCPNELLSQILQYLQPCDTLSFSLVSRRCYSVANDPVLWKYYCHEFKYWQGNVSAWLHDYKPDVNWKQTYLLRAEANSRVSQHFEAIISSTVGRNDRISKISSYGFDAKDFLLRQRQTPDDHPQVLCRRWWAKEALNAVHRAIVLGEWATTMYGVQPAGNGLGDGYKPQRLERFLRVLGLIVLHQDDDEPNSLSSKLDDLARSFREQHPFCMRKSIPERAILLLRWFNDLTIINPPHFGSQPVQYRIPIVGETLFDQMVASKSPVVILQVLLAIFVTLAQRLDVPAYFSSTGKFIVVPHTDGGKSVNNSKASQLLVLWPGMSYNCLPKLANDDGLLVMTEDEFVRSFLQLYDDQFSDPPSLYHSTLTYPTTYLLCCAELLLAPLTLLSRSEYTAAMKNVMLEELEGFVPDMWAMERHVEYLLDTYAPPEVVAEDSQLLSEIKDCLHRMKLEDAMKANICKRRCIRCRESYRTDCSACPRFRVGDVVTTVPDGHVGFITNWWTPSESSGDSITYLCKTAGEQDNEYSGDADVFVRVHDPALVTTELMYSAGQHCQRFDAINCRFVPNNREFYPDD